MTELDDSVVGGVGDENDSARTDRAASSAYGRLLALEQENGARGSEPAPPVSTNELTRRGRVKKWNRPPPPHDWRWWIGNLGKALIALGLLMFGFVAYQLWGTGIETARAQNALESDFEELLAAAPAIDPALATETVLPPGPAEPAEAADPAEPTVSDVTADAGPVEVLPVAAQNIPEVERGDALARIEIPSIGVDDIVVAGVKTSDLKKGPGHFPETPLPGQLGNSAIAGHRTTYGQPFHNVDKLEPGDEIIVTTLSGTFVYRVTGQQIVAPSAGEVVATADPTRATLTLTSCHPKWTARERIVISSELDTAASSVVGEPVINYGQPLPAAEPTDEAVEIRPATDGTTAPGPEAPPGVSETPAAPGTVGIEALGSAAATQGIADAFAEGWFSDPAANPHVGFWGVLLALVGIGSYLISRRFRRDWLGATVGLVPFLLTLYFFFQNVNRLLPPNL